ncbi:unnamed protein product [Rotaria magnacalcarata]
MMISRDSIHHNTDRNREASQTLSDRDRRIPEKKFHRVSHFNPTGIVLTAFCNCLDEETAPSIPIQPASSTPTPSVSICGKTFAFDKNISMSERLYQWLTGKPKIHTKVE